MYIPAGGLSMALVSGAVNIATGPEGTADELGAVVSPIYHCCFDEYGTYPYTIDQLESTYAYAIDHAEELRIDPDKIIITGMSSGGHLALALCHRLKNKGYTPRGCLATISVIDERLIYPSSHYEGNGWDAGGIYVSSTTWPNDMPTFRVPAEAFANHATVDECIGLLPTVIFTNEQDACVDPCLQYASKLIKAGVYTTIHVMGGLIHGDSNPDSDYMKYISQCKEFEFKNLIKYDLRRPWTMTEGEE